MASTSPASLDGRACGSVTTQTFLKASAFTRASFVRLPARLSSSNWRMLRVACEGGAPATAGESETLKKVVEIVTKQLAAQEGTVKPQSKFQDLGADSLDQVEIVMALEEEFKISVDEDGAGAIVTVQDAADLIDKVLSKA